MVFEMETSDPDDFMTLLWLADHPRVDLKAVVVTPGSPDQCQLVRWALDKCGSSAQLASTRGPMWWGTEDGKKARVSGFHYKVYGEEIRSKDPGLVVHGPSLVGGLLADPQAGITYLVGSAPKCLGETFRRFGEVRLERWVQQGFFAGDNVVEERFRLEKFKGHTTCPSFNPGGDPKSALELLASDRIRTRVAVSKNVCHGVVWTHEMQQQLSGELQRQAWAVSDDGKSAGMTLRFPRSDPGRTAIPTKTRTGLQIMTYGLDCYLQDKGVGKAMHDILAAAYCVDPMVVSLVEVDIYRERGEWGSRQKDGTRTWISYNYDKHAFVQALAHYA